MQHVIRKQVIHIQTSDSQSIYQLQQETSQYYYNTVIPVLEKIFDELCSEDHVIVFDHIELDMGVLKSKESDLFIPERELYPLLRKQFEKYIADIEDTTFENDYTTDSAGNHLKKTQIIHAFDQWLYYMQHGLLPWNIKLTDEELHIRVLETLSTNLQSVNRLKKHIRLYPSAALRIVRLHKESFLVNLIEAVTAKKQSDLSALISSINAAFGDTTQPTAIEKLWLAVLTEATEKHDQKEVLQLLQHAIAVTYAPEDLTKPKLVAITEKRPVLQRILLPFMNAGTAFSNTPQEADPDRNVLTEEKMKPHPATKEIKKEEGHTGQNEMDNTTAKKRMSSDEQKRAPGSGLSAHEKTNSVSGEGMILQQKSNPDATNVIPPFNEKTATSETEIAFHKTTNTLLEEGVFVQHAGLILLHPFYQFLFRNTGLTKGGVFVSRLAQQKALYLLHYIATGEKTAEEHMLALPKIVCGWSLTEPVIADAALTESMIVEADDLIRAAIAQWTILKNTSIEGLRESFLQREGKVFTKAGKLYIQVEKKSIDMLLDHLPWNTSIVKFPWLNDILWVEWR